MATTTSIQGTDRFPKPIHLKNTLQGNISTAKDLVTNKRVVIKAAYKTLVHSKQSRDRHRVQENFLQERNILKTLTDLADQTPSEPITGFAKYIDEWEDEKKYYYAMELCQVELFQYVKDFSTTIGSKSTKPQIPMSSPNPRVQNVITIFAQLCNTVQWLHRNGFCHLDLSLENVMISDLKTLKVKIIDFGVAKKFHHNNFLHEGRIGKIGYMPPEAYAKKIYDARAADVWCLGVMLFMLLTGAPLFQRGAGKNDDVFKFIFSGHRIRDLLAHWKRLHLVTEQALDLLDKIFKYEKDRISLEDIIRHPFLRGKTLCFYPVREPISKNRQTLKNDHDELMDDKKKALPSQSEKNTKECADIWRYDEGDQEIKKEDIATDDHNRFIDIDDLYTASSPIKLMHNMVDIDPSTGRNMFEYAFNPQNGKRFMKTNKIKETIHEQHRTFNGWSSLQQSSRQCSSEVHHVTSAYAAESPNKLWNFYFFNGDY